MIPSNTIYDGSPDLNSVFGRKKLCLIRKRRNERFGISEGSLLPIASHPAIIFKLIPCRDCASLFTVDFTGFHRISPSYDKCDLQCRVETKLQSAKSCLCRYQSANSFCVAFKLETGMSPEQYATASTTKRMTAPHLARSGAGLPAGCAVFGLVFSISGNAR
jgi:hypothetical protein